MCLAMPRLVFSPASMMWMVPSACRGIILGRIIATTCLRWPPTKSCSKLISSICACQLSSCVR